MKRRERHGRGLRGPLSGPNPFTPLPVAVPYRSRGVEYFASCVRASAERIQTTCPRALVGLDLGFEDVPSLTGFFDRVPLASAVSGRPGENARVVLYRRPLEHRASSRPELARLVHRTVVEQLSALTGIGTDELDPALEPED